VDTSLLCFYKGSGIVFTIVTAVNSVRNEAYPNPSSFYTARMRTVAVTVLPSLRPAFNEIQTFERDQGARVNLVVAYRF
jgi:hypothetical protein